MLPSFALLASTLAFFQPALFIPGKSLIIPLLAAIMFCMGLTQRKEDFLQVLRQPKAMALGLLLQYSLMPLLAFSIGWILALESELLIGLILVGCCAGGTASNVMTFLAKGNVALSISLTLASTLMGVLLTPLLIQLYGGKLIEVALLPMLLTIAKIVLLPLCAGLLLRHFFAKQVTQIEGLLPHFATTFIVIIIAIVVALNQHKAEQINSPLILAIMLHNILGLTLGFIIARKLNFDTGDCKAIAIEVGMQNSGLAVALAVKYFSASAALPGALFSIWHNLSGSMLAHYWKQVPSKKEQDQNLASINSFRKN